MTETQKFWIEATIKALGLCIAAFAIFTYFNDLRVDRENGQTSAALEYVNRYGDGESVTHRVNLANFWLSHSTLAALVSEEDSEQRITRENYRNLFGAVLRKYEDTEIFWRSFLIQAVFLEELAFCYHHELCNQEVVEAFFCGHVNDFVVVYGPATEILADRLGNSTFGQSIQRLAEECPK